MARRCARQCERIMSLIDLYSDTKTVPTEAMRAAMAAAKVGDEQMDEDPTTRALCERVAMELGFEAAVFMPSGTMSNQISLRTHLVQPPHSVLCDYRSHINRYVSASLSPDREFTPGRYEAGGAAFHSGAHTIAVIPSNRHHLMLSDVKQFIVQGSDIHLYETVNRGYGLGC